MGLINRQVEFQPGETAKAEEVNAEYNVIHDVINGGIENSNISDNSIDLTQKGEDSSIQSSMIAENAVTGTEISDSAKDQIKDDGRLQTNDLKIELRDSSDGDVSPSASNAGRIWLRTDL